MEIFGKDIALNILEYGGYLPGLDPQDIIERIKWYNLKFNIRRYETVSTYENVAFNSEFKDVLLYIHYNGISTISVENDMGNFIKLKFTPMTERLQFLLLSSFPNASFHEDAIYVGAKDKDRLTSLNLLIRVVSKIKTDKIFHVKLRQPAFSNIIELQVQDPTLQFNYLGFLHDYYLNKSRYSRAKCLPQSHNMLDNVQLTRILRQAVINDKIIKQSIDTRYRKLYDLIVKADEIVVYKQKGKALFIFYQCLTDWIIKEIEGKGLYKVNSHYSNCIQLDISDEDYIKLIELYNTYHPYGYQSIYTDVQYTFVY
ncbi:hypothetical protein D3C87_1249570 [compost metagenome]